MIQIRFNDVDFEYDIRGLLMAFFPGEAIAAVMEGDPEGEWDRLVKAEYHSHRIVLEYREKQGPDLREEQRTGEDRKETKSILKRMLYGMLKETTGKELPWGTLTGIRPVKIPMALLDMGWREEDIRRHMEEVYLTSEEKTDLSIEIAKREREILKPLDYENGYSLYIGIPFCPTTCLYCSFTSYPLSRWESRVDEYLEALFQEIDYGREDFKGKKLNTIYIGGGTPTTLSPSQLERLLGKIVESFDLSWLLEFTVEAGRPDSVTREKLKVLKSFPVDRISINPQTMKEETLRLIGRRHTVEQVREAFALARETGHENINMDLILGLPEEDLDDVKHTLEEVGKLDPDNITVHSLAVKRAARLNTMKEVYGKLHMENTPEMMAFTENYARGLGHVPYYLYRQKNMAGNFENVGYAKPGKAGIYNILIMEEKQSILALGAGATTKAVFKNGRIERADNVKDVDQYISRVGEMIDRKKRLFGQED